MGKKDSPPSAPDPARSYQQGIQIYMKNLPKMLRQEYADRLKWDPKYLEQQQALQAQYGPTQYAQQLRALQQLDPTGVAMRNALGTQITQGLNRGYLDPIQRANYQALGKDVTSGVLREGVGSQRMLRDIGQSIEGRLSANPYSGGNAPAMARGVYTGQRLQQAKGAAQQASLQFAGLRSPEQDAITNAGMFMGLRTPMQDIAGIQGVQVPSNARYVNPQAGYMGQQWGLQNYQNQLGQYQSQQGGGNPWMGALSGAASGAAAGGSMGGGYGAAAGAVGGAALGYFGSSY